MIHHCHAHRCDKPVPPARFACPAHWYSLRKEMQDAVWREYVNGQEIRKDASVRYLAVQQRAIAEIVLYKPKSAKGLAIYNEALAKETAAPYLANSERWRQAAIKAGHGDPLAFLQNEET